MERINDNFKQEIQTVFSQLLVEAADLCQSIHEAETIVEDLISSMLAFVREDDTSGESGKKEEEEEGNSAAAVKNEAMIVSPRIVWNAIEEYFELDNEERKTAFRKCQEYCRRQQLHVDQRRKLLPSEDEVATFFLDSGEVHQELFSSHHDDNECSEYSDKDSNEDDDNDDSEDESAYYFMNYDDESHCCELCERTNIKLTKHHLIPKSTWPRIRTRLLHAMEALERGDVNKSNMILGGANLDHVLATVVSFSSKTTTSTRINSSHKKSKQQPEKEDSHRAHIRHALSYTCTICRQCHSMIHSTHDNMTLALEYNTIEKLLDDAAISKYCHWASKQRAGKYRL